MFSNYDEQAKAVMLHTLNMAIKYNSQAVGTEHLIMGFLSNAIFAKHAEKCEVTYDVYERLVDEFYGADEKEIIPAIGEMNYSPAMLNIMQEASVIAISNQQMKIRLVDLIRAFEIVGNGIGASLIDRLLKDTDYDFYEILDEAAEELGTFVSVNDATIAKKPISTKFYNTWFRTDETNLLFVKSLSLSMVSKSDLANLQNSDFKLNKEFLVLHHSKAKFQTEKGTFASTIIGFVCEARNAGFMGRFNQQGECIAKSTFPIKDMCDLNEHDFNVQPIKEFYELADTNEVKILNVEDILFGQIANAEVIRDDVANKIRKLSKKADARLNEFTFLANINDRVKKKKTVVVGVDKEIEKLIRSVSQLRKPNAVILGAPGVGKTALVEGLAIAINNGNVPESMKDCLIYELQISNAVAGTKYRGEFEERLQRLISVLQDSPNIILFIDEFHTVVGAGGAEGAIDAANILKPALARGDIKVIGATTFREWEESVEKDGALVRRFTQINLKEPDLDTVHHILMEAKKNFEEHYGMIITAKDIDVVLAASKKRAGNFPDIALDELEDFCLDRLFDTQEGEDEDECSNSAEVQR